MFNFLRWSSATTTTQGPPPPPPPPSAILPSAIPGATVAAQYASFIDFVGGLAIFILGLQAMYESIANK